ncbi:MAG TPA: polyprenyl synthetase family protein [Bacteroidales bacterium]|nr:polyprenyl synthetase family protein [Bacteroidales bacterium]
MKNTIQHYQEIFTERFNKINFVKFPHELYEPIDYALRAGGKRLRPVLTIMICDFYGNNIEDAMNPAIAIETFHNFTLVHDDIMDNAPIRRGRPTVYNKYGTNIGILSGDTMFTKAYEFVTLTREDKLPAVLKVFTKTAMEVCEGQQLDMNFETMPEVTMEEYMQMILLKTAVLMGACLKIGAILGNATAEQSEAIYRFGEHTGMVFQLQDDLLDTFGDEKTFGKRIGGDILDCKKTYLYVNAMGKLKGDERQDFQQLYNNKTMDEVEKIIRVKEFLINNNVIADCKAVMQNHHNLAMEALSETGLKADQKAILQEFAESMLVRDF